MNSRAMRATGRHMMKSTSVSGEIYGMEHTDGSQSDTALGSLGSGIKKRRSSLSQRVVAILPSRRSRSTSQLSQTGQRTVWLDTLRNHHTNAHREKERNTRKQTRYLTAITGLLILPSLNYTAPPTIDPHWWPPMLLRVLFHQRITTTIILRH